MEQNKGNEVAIIEVKDYKDENSESFKGIGEIIGRIFRFIGKIIKKGNTMYLEVKKDGEKTIRISLTLSVIFLVFLSVPTIILLVTGLFMGYKYSVSSKDMNCAGVNSMFDEISKSADTIKKDFKEGFNK
ncbi:MAG: DUF4342 domain-containing protein [Sarcina sp.]